MWIENIVNIVDNVVQLDKISQTKITFLINTIEISKLEKKIFQNS